MRPIKYFLSLIILISASALSQPTNIAQVGTAEYVTVYRMANHTCKIMSQLSVTPLLSTYIGIDSIIDVQGAQYHVAALDEQGKVYQLGTDPNPYNSVSHPLGWKLITTDSSGNPFTGNLQVKGFWQCNVTLRGPDSSLWYGGRADPMNYSGAGGNDTKIMRPFQIPVIPGGRKPKYFETGASSTLTDSYILVICSDNTVWKYNRNAVAGGGMPGPVQITIPGETFTKITTLGANAQVLVTASNKIFAAGYYSMYAGTPTNTTTFTDVTSKWTDAGMQFPIKQMSGNSNTLHIIDVNDNFFGSGTNAQGEVGTGVELTPYRTANSIPGMGVFGYGFVNGLLLTPPTRIQGKVKNFCSSTTITFYSYVQDLEGNWYVDGRDKSFSLGDGSSLGPYPGWGGAGDYASYPNADDNPMYIQGNPDTVTYTLRSFSANDSLPPKVGAGFNQYISTANTTLYGKAFQQEHRIASVQWTKISGPAGGVIISPNSLTTDVNLLQVGTYVYQLTGTNTHAQSKSDRLKVVVSDLITVPDPEPTPAPSGAFPFPAGSSFISVP